MSRSIAALVDELQSVAVDEGIPFAAIIVGFEKNSEFVVWNGDAAAPLRELNEKVERGGEPIGRAGSTSHPQVVSSGCDHSNNTRVKSGSTTSNCLPSMCSRRTTEANGRASALCSVYFSSSSQSSDETR